MYNEETFNAIIQEIPSWRGPYKIADRLTSPQFGLPGIYLWTFTSRSEEIPYYLGETGKSFRARHADHLRCYRSGEYGLLCIHSIETNGEIKRIRESRYGMYSQEDKILFKLEIDKWIPLIESEIEHVNVWLFPMLYTSRAFRMRLEQATGNQIYGQDDARFKVLFDYAEWRRRKHDSWFHTPWMTPSAIAFLGTEIVF